LWTSKVGVSRLERRANWVYSFDKRSRLQQTLPYPSEIDWQRVAWASLVVVLGTISLATGVYRPGGFWNSYVLDMAGPAWNYVLVRGLFAEGRRTVLTRFFTPLKALLFVVTVCFVVELMQYFQLYASTFDPVDLVAYISLVLPCYALDRGLLASNTGTERNGG
jgi:hypothetical protein